MNYEIRGRELRDPRMWITRSEDVNYEIRGSHSFVMKIQVFVDIMSCWLINTKVSEEYLATIFKINKSKNSSWTSQTWRCRHYIFFFEMSVNIYNLVWRAISENVNLNINFVWIWNVWWNLKEEALGRTGRRTRFGSGYGPVVGQTTQRMNVILYSIWGSYWQFFLPVYLAIIPTKAGGMAIIMQPNVETTDKIWALLVVFIENILWK